MVLCLISAAPSLFFNDFLGFVAYIVDWAHLRSTLRVKESSEHTSWAYVHAIHQVVIKSVIKNKPSLSDDLIIDIHYIVVVDYTIFIQCFLLSFTADTN